MIGTPRVCGYGVECCRSKKHGVYIYQFFFTFFSRATIERESRALLSPGLPLVIFVWERRWEAVMYDVTWHLLTLGCYGSFGYCYTTEALQADTEQRSGILFLIQECAFESSAIKFSLMGENPVFRATAPDRHKQPTEGRLSLGPAETRAVCALGRLLQGTDSDL